MEGLRRIGVLTSGGDAPGMNAAIRSVVRTAIYSGLEIMGIKRGYEGLLDSAFVELNLGSVGDTIHRGGTILQTARSERFKTPEGMVTCVDNCRAAGIGALVIIGGDGSFRGALALSKLGIRTVGVPGTIDNDIALTDRTIGFDTAVNTVVDAINRVRDTATSHGRVFIIETMGRESGAIALYAGVAGGAESVIIPEIPVNFTEISDRVLRGIKRGKQHSIIMVAEGCYSAFEVGERLEKLLGISTKKIVLGHIQRGGSPTAFDRILASRMGAKAVELIINGKSGMMVGSKGEEILAVDISECLNTKKEIVAELMNLTNILSI